MTGEVPGSPAIPAVHWTWRRDAGPVQKGSVSGLDSDTALVASAGLRPARFASPAAQRGRSGAWAAPGDIRRWRAMAAGWWWRDQVRRGCLVRMTGAR
jgi:hypothetical protein